MNTAALIQVQDTVLRRQITVIERLTGISADDQSLAWFEASCDFLDKLDPKLAPIASKHKTFWSWAQVRRQRFNDHFITEVLNHRHLEYGKCLSRLYTTNQVWVSYLQIREYFITL